MSKRNMSERESRLLGYLLDVNSNLPLRVMSSLREGLDNSLVEELGSGLTLSFSRGAGSLVGSQWSLWRSMRVFPFLFMRSLY